MYSQWLHVLVGQVLLPNALRFKRYIQKYNLSDMLILVMTSQLSKFMEMVLNIKNWISPEKNMAISWNEKNS